MSGTSADFVYLHSYLSPLAEILARPGVTDVYVNRPGEIWSESITGAIECHPAPALDEATLERLARQIAALSHQGISREHPLLSASLPNGARVQIVAPPATRGSVVLAIRKNVSPDLSLDEYAAAGAFADTKPHAGNIAIDRTLEALLEAGDIAGLLRAAVVARKNVLVAGGTSTGKTTFLNALLREVPADERLVLIEDTPELVLRHRNAIGLIAVRGALGEAQITTDELVTASLRMRPDRIIVGELRGAEAYAFLRAVNSGHPGSLTTVHADSAESAIEQITLLVLQTGIRLDRSDVHHYVKGTIGLFVQLARTGGRRRVTDVVLASKLPTTSA